MSPSKNSPTEKTVLTLGTFDGVHRGHQRLLALARRRARALGAEVLAVAFERPPRLFFTPDNGPALLTTPREKEFLLRAHGADRVVSVPFSASLSVLSAGQFLDRFVVGQWKANEIVVGFNFRFGRGREGDGSFLKQWARAEGKKVHLVSAVTQGGQVVSSGVIRSLVARGDLEKATPLLGHDYIVEGPVVSGRGVGRTLGFPTANVDVPDDKIVPLGVWAVKAWLPTGIERTGVLNVGCRPTFREKSGRSVEAHLLDFGGTLTGRPLRLALLKKIRDEIQFPSVQALIRQIGRDVQFARRCS
ncbi:MAG: riboflavin biosynthesis protein RibF [Elusimicrobia bacterium]|nr:riboflavin biosynthesis protein RibF [Elusimicrobiota bacterium]